MGEKDILSLTRTEETILALLMERVGAERYGLEMVEISKGALARGSIYVYLDRMTKKGLVQSRSEDPDPRRSGMPRRLYKVTGLGAQVFRAWCKLQAIGGRDVAGVYA